MSSMKNMTLANIAGACGGILCGIRERGSDHREGNCPERDQEASCVVIDSRKVQPGGVFIATRGASVDGHTFIPEVAAKGVLGVVCEKAPEGCDIPYILVKDSLQALKDIAEYYRKGLAIPVVGITGSVGKTSTKEFIASVCSVRYRVLKTEGNFNNEIGLPLTVLSIRQEHEMAVLEMGISDFGEMHRLSKIARPDLVVMTNIGQSHLENLGSREGILKAKSEIFDFMNPEGCTVVNGDDDLLCHMEKKGNRQILHFGRNSSNEFFASRVESRGLTGSSIMIHGDRKVFSAEVPLPGEHMILNALAAAAVGTQMGLSPEEIAEGISRVEIVSGRGNVVRTPSYTLIDGSYNSNPGSAKAAIDMLNLAFERKVALLGDMFELGEQKEQLHREVGVYAAEQGIDVLVCTGELSRHMYEGAEAPGETKGNKGKTEVFYFENRDEMIEGLPRILKKGDAVLVKASHGMHFEKVVEWLKQA